MKVIHRITKTQHDVVEIIGNGVTLRSIENGVTKKLEYALFKKHYKLIDDKDTPEAVGLTVEGELKEAKGIVEELTKGSAKGSQAPTSRVRIDPTNMGEQLPKPKTPKKKNKKEVTKGEAGDRITLKDLCDKLKLDPGKARRVLRKKGFSSPYEWSSSDPGLSEIEKVLNKG